MKNFRLLILMIVALVILPAQDFGRAWDNFLTIDSDLNSVLAKLDKIVEHQSILQAEIEVLKTDRTWYNGWINEMLLARKTTTFATLADSAAILQTRSEQLKISREQALRSLKKEYTDILQQGNLTDSDKERAISLGTWMMGRPSGKIDLPDYTTLLEIEYEDEQIRQLVWRDLRVVVAAKLTIVDSLLNERYLEQELLKRLNEFHQDLSLQQESNRDLGSPASSRSVFTDAEATFGGGEYDVNNELDVGWKSTQELVDIALIEQSDLNFNPEGAAVAGTLPVTRSTSGEISRLTTKRRHYQEILARLEAELSPVK
ncbi:MAG: hypothetical protein KAK01_05100 [Candidatus Marinimicrobia bacterium]|nr:hypothetical protein [Candidatus Neomarinimicrobiota bacterium]